MRYFYYSLGVAFTLFFIGCKPSTQIDNTNNKSENFSNYYYPIQKFQDGVVYEYTSSDDAPPTWWYLKSGQDEKYGDCLFRYRFNPYFENDIITKEVATEKGIASLFYHFLFIDGEGNQIIRKAVIKSNAIHPFEMYEDTTQAMRLHMNCSLYPDTNTIIGLMRDRRIAKKMKYPYQDTEKSAIMVKTRERIQIINADNMSMPDTTHKEDIYVENVGLVFSSSNKKIGNIPQTMRLTKIYSKEEFEALAASKGASIKWPATTLN